MSEIQRVEGLEDVVVGIAHIFGTDVYVTGPISKGHQ
jgi:hypothetical protein